MGCDNQANSHKGAFFKFGHVFLQNQPNSTVNKTAELIVVVK